MTILHKHKGVNRRQVLTMTGAGILAAGLGVKLTLRWEA